MYTGADKPEKPALRKSALAFLQERNRTYSCGSKRHFSPGAEQPAPTVVVILLLSTVDLIATREIQCVAEFTNLQNNSLRAVPPQPYRRLRRRPSNNRSCGIPSHIDRSISRIHLRVDIYLQKGHRWDERSREGRYDDEGGG